MNDEARIGPDTAERMLRGDPPGHLTQDVAAPSPGPPGHAGQTDDTDDARHALGSSHARTVDDGRKRSAPPTKRPKTKASKSKPNEPAKATSSAATPTSGANRRPSALSSGSVTAWSSPVLLTFQPVGRCCSLPAGGSSVSARLRKTYSS